MLEWSGVLSNTNLDRSNHELENTLFFLNKNPLCEDIKSKCINFLFFLICFLIFKAFFFTKRNISFL